MSEYKPIDECETVAELLADPARWTKFEMARDSNGEECHEKSPLATCFCVEGACIRIYGNGDRNMLYEEWPSVKAEMKLKNSLGIKYGNIARWNDAPERTHAEVLEAVKRAGI